MTNDEREKLISEAAERAFLSFINPSPEAYQAIMRKLVDDLDRVRRSQLMAIASEREQQGRLSSAASVRTAVSRVFGDDKIT